MIIKIIKLHHRLFGYGLCKNVNRTNFPKNCLLLYIVDPFLTGQIKPFHQNQWQVKELATIVSEFGFNVDVMNYNNTKVKLTVKYDLIIDLHPGLNNAYKNHMSDSCLRVAYITGSNPSFSNKAESDRLDYLFRRKGIRLRPMRYVNPFDKYEMANLDAVFFIGNSYNLKTFSGCNLKRVYYIKNTGYDFLKNEDFSKKSPQNFLFLGGVGQVLKGLDLLLDAFSRNKHLNLYVCTDFENEKIFCKIYKKELFHSSNIYPLGFVDITSNQFKNLTKICSYIILPSCSEGISGSVLTGMSAGLIPIVSRECGLEDNEVYHLQENSVEFISQIINMFSKKQIDWIITESRKAMEIVADKYSKNNYSVSVRNAMKGLLQNELYNLFSKIQSLL
jgi:hypothetical protein